MSTRVRLLSVALLILMILITGGSAVAQGPDDPAPLAALGGSATYSFTYQGYLEDGGAPANGSYDFLFRVFDSSAPAANLVDTLNSFVPLTAVAVEDGLFSFNLKPQNKSMSQVFDGGERWIDVRVRPAGVGSYTTLPRQPIAPAPYAWSLEPGAVITGTIPNGSVLTVGNAYDAGTIGSAIYAENHADTSPTIAGRHFGDGPAIYGYAEGVYPAVEGLRNDDGVAVAGYATSGQGILGSASTTDGIGVVGVQSGSSPSDVGIWRPGGYFGGRNGVIGVSKTTAATASMDRVSQRPGICSIGVYGETSSSTGWAGSFRSPAGNGVYISVPVGKAGLNVANGTKNAVVRTEDGARLLYTEESTEVWFTDYGFGTLESGTTTISIDPIFAQTVNLDEPYHVFVEPYGPASLYVTDRTATSFTVRSRE